MALRCFLFSSDQGASDVIRQVMTDLGVEGESCSQATVAVEKLANELFQLVIIDWDQQPEAGMLISAARERKPLERPLVLAVVSDDVSVSKALQAGANSILRKPLLSNQVTDTLTTARDLLRSRHESAAANAAAAGASSSTPGVGGAAAPPSLRAGEFLQSAPLAPSAQIETESEVAHFGEQSAAEQTDPLKDLEPVAAAVAESSSQPPPPDEAKGLEWYLKKRGVSRQPGAVMATSPAPTNEEKPELLGYDQTSSSGDAGTEAISQAPELQKSTPHEEKQEAQLFSYIMGEKQDAPERSESRFKIGKKPIIVALVLAACAVVAAPQAPWHGKLIGLAAQGRRALHGWLNPQATTAVTQAPTSHEDFGRAGDEYKLPVAESIPDATTDPSQISVVPVVDPTAKKPANDPNAGQPTVIPDAAPANPTEAIPTNPVQTPAAQPTGVVPDTAQPMPTTPPPPPPTSSTPADTPHLEASPVNPPPAASMSLPKPSPVVPHPQEQYTPVPTKVPSSLKSQMATMVPDASGNKPAEAALPAIEPVDVPELTERALLVEQPPTAYPANAGGKQGTVTLQVLIGRDGTVQDAKFLQGSLAFARAAIDGVKQWKFKPYTMNGRPVSVQTSLTLKFAPAQ
ncbi:MAG TPA: TonB family protein [Candidatus Sulfotelmatobacter sp.]|nr:TonB family protein [Candidatus Sulfotelmatobacter sp.]